MRLILFTMRSSPPQQGGVQATSAASAVEAATEPTLAVPRVLAFYEDVWDADGNVIAWRTIAWGLAIADGSVVTIPVDRPTSATLWLALADAAAALDAHVDAVDPRRPVNDVLPSHAYTAPPPRSWEGAAAPTACPDDPGARDGRDRPVGGFDAAGGVPQPSAERWGS